MTVNRGKVPISEQDLSLHDKVVKVAVKTITTDRRPEALLTLSRQLEQSGWYRI